MPIYEYKCSECSTQHECIQKITDAPKTECPDCGGELYKLISLNSFQLKGGGWYADGYSSKQPGTESSTKTGSVENCRASTVKKEGTANCSASSTV
ncbi:FmdB family zinc ribbon protein [Desulfosediminicola flagellatus]|uniref:FmdB family zinc ribbon protein n=1 Tax=Desulfosediminicola flagellatus TaxID=2569541 RepID=UPI0010ABC607|nr:zinc ribbon domain-containing protein [Desulfosediminicola flagellatus]